MTTPVPRLGAVPDPTGTTFSVYSESAEAVMVCLFDASGVEERFELPHRHGAVHHGHIPGVGPGARYGLRIDGPWAPERGLWANPAKLLIDPYADAVHGEVRWGPEVYGAVPDDLGTPSGADSAPFMPRCVVVDHTFDWGDDRHPEVPWTDTVIYETHVKSLTQLHPDVPEHHRGTYLGLTAPAVLDHLVSLGVTAVELMPVHHFAHDHRLVKQGLRNLWGYQPIGWAAPHHGYTAGSGFGDQVTELKQVVKALHGLGIEVFLDVVFNHSGEGNHTGPHLSLRGIDNPTYYRLDEHDPRRYLDLTGTGNAINADHPAVTRLVADSLRRWVLDYHIDGFRFDLTTTLGRYRSDFDPVGPFFHIVGQDPVLRQVKLIAEPWDVGPGGYRLGGFPYPWREWNDRYRSTVRDFWRNTPASMGDLATRLAGSADTFAHSGRRAATTSINYVVSHDGFTLSDLVSYDQRHNDANGENGNDGHPDNRSWNGGVEGPTDDPGITEQRNRRRRSLLATLLISQGVPMLAGGDELGRTQQGNNNAYAQDNEISWYDWGAVDEPFVRFVRSVVALRTRNAVFRQRRWLTGDAPLGSPLEDIAWLAPDGSAMTDAGWNEPGAQQLMVHLNGDAVPGPQRSVSFLILLNGDAADADFTVPTGLGPLLWHPVIDTATANGPAPARFRSGDILSVGGYGLLVLTDDGTDHG